MEIDWVVLTDIQSLTLQGLNIFEIFEDWKISISNF